MLQPAQFFVKKRSSEKSEALVTVSVLDNIPEVLQTQVADLAVNTAASGNNAAAIQFFGRPSYIAELALKLDSSALAPAWPRGGIGHHGRAGGRASASNTCCEIPQTSRKWCRGQRALASSHTERDFRVFPESLRSFRRSISSMTWARKPLSLEGVSQMDSILPERLVRPAFDVVLRRIRSLKRCVQA